MAAKDMRVLVIDDEESIRKSFTLALEGTRHAVETASSGDEGIGKIQRGSYDLIFLDIHMPGKGGLETLKEIRKIGCQAPVMIITAFRPEYLRDLLALQDDGYNFDLLSKPIQLEEIKALCDGTVRGFLHSKTPITKTFG